MNRKEFLKLMGFSASAFVASNFLFSCSSDDTATAPENVDFTIDLDAPEYSFLKTKGEFLVKDNVIVAHTINDEYIALTALCTHESAKLTYDDFKDIIYCPKHYSEFSKDGKVIKGPAKKSLSRFVVELNGSMLRIHS